MKLNIVLVEPEIPQNTGNIARTCAAIGAKLHLVHPLGFILSEKSVKRAGLDYWDKLDIEEHSSLNDFLSKYPPESNNMFFSTTKGKHIYSEPDYICCNGSSYSVVFYRIQEWYSDWQRIGVFHLCDFDCDAFTGNCLATYVTCCHYHSYGNVGR